MMDLITTEAVTALRALFPLADLLTPNLPEAADLLGIPEAQTRADMQRQAQALLRLGPRAVLLKGGHLADADCPDLYLDAQGRSQWLTAPRTLTRNTHGTGCTLSSALATQLALTGNLLAACIAAKAYVSAAIAGADRLSVGHGLGPTDHFHLIRTNP